MEKDCVRRHFWVQAPGDILSLKQLWDHTNELSQDFQSFSPEASGFIKLLTQEWAEQELIHVNEVMKDDCGFCLEYCWCVSVLFSGYISDHLIFSLNLSIIYNNSVD